MIQLAILEYELPHLDVVNIIIFICIFQAPSTLLYICMICAAAVCTYWILSIAMEDEIEECASRASSGSSDVHYSPKTSPLGASSRSSANPSPRTSPINLSPPTSPLYSSCGEDSCSSSASSSARRRKVWFLLSVI